MRFLIRTPRYYAPLYPRQVLRNPRFYYTAIVVLVGLLWLMPFPAFAENLNLAFYASDQPYGEATASLDIGGVALSARHVEFLGYLNHALHSDAVEDGDPLLRRSRLAGESVVNLDDGAGLPLGVAVTLDAWESGRQDLRINADSGLDFSGVAIDHRLTVTTSFLADGGQERHMAGRLRLGLSAPGAARATYEGIVEYDAGPLTQVTLLGINSEWQFDGGRKTMIALTHHPIDGLSEARFGYRQPWGPFELTSDFAADSEGAYAIGMGLAIPLGPAPEPVSWSLRDLLTSLNGPRQPAYNPALATN